MAMSLSDAWRLTGLLSPRSTVRAADSDAGGTILNSYSRIHCVQATAPLVPWAIHLTGKDRRFHFVVADFDARPAAVAQADAASFVALLNELAIPHVVCQSGPSGGRHVWIGLAQAVDADVVAGLAQLMRYHYASFDPVPLLNPATGAVRPPGAPHRAGGTSMILTGSIEALVSPTVTLADLARVSDRICAETTAATPSPQTSSRVGKRVTASETGMPRIAGTPRPLSRQTLDRIETQPAPDADMSVVLFEIMLGAARACWPFADTAKLLFKPGLEHARSMKRDPSRTSRTPRPATGAQSPLEVLGRTWRKAVAQVAASPVKVTDDATFDRRAAVGAHVVQQVQDRADRSPGRWASQTGLADRRILDALCLFSLQAVKGAVEADIRRLGMTCGFCRETARAALLRLQTDGWILRTQEAAGVHGACWTIDPTGSIHRVADGWLSQGDAPPAGLPRSWWSALLAERLQLAGHETFDAHPGLGMHAGTLYSRMSGAVGTLEMSRLLGWETAEVPKLFERLASEGLVVHEGDGWRRTGTVELDRAAWRCGVLGAHQRRAEAYAIERKLWAWWLAELEWMKAPRAKRAPRRRPGRPGFAQVALIPDRHDNIYGAHPRRPDHRADYAAARLIVEDDVTRNLAAA
jgi:hypothetical protein